MTAALPNFFVVGAPKAGTTSLCKYLEQHPQIFVSPIKEPCFFAPEVRDFSDETRRRAAEGAMVFDWDRYRRLFDGVRGERAIGEGSVSYLSSPGAPGAIRERIPNARIIMMLRDPSDRLFSHYVGACATGATTRGFVAWMAEQRAIEAGRRPAWGHITPGWYASHLSRYLAVFPASQVCVLLYDDYVQTPERVYRDVLKFLDVDSDFPLDALERHNVTLVPRWPRLGHRWIAPVRRTIRAVLPRGMTDRVHHALMKPRGIGPRADERDEVIALYESDIRELQRLIGRDLSAWLDARQSAATA